MGLCGKHCSERLQPGIRWPAWVKAGTRQVHPMSAAMNVHNYLSLHFTACNKVQKKSLLVLDRLPACNHVDLRGHLHGSIRAFRTLMGCLLSIVLVYDLD